MNGPHKDAVNGPITSTAVSKIDVPDDRSAGLPVRRIGLEHEFFLVDRTGALSDLADPFLWRCREAAEAGGLDPRCFEEQCVKSLVEVTTPPSSGLKYLSKFLLLGSNCFGLESAGFAGYYRFAAAPPSRSGAVRSVTAPEQGGPTAYSGAKASRNCFSCSSGRLVEMISKSYCLSSSTTLSTVAPLVSANSAEVPGVTFSRTCLTKSSLMPTSANEPDSAPMPAPIAAPRKGTKKISPNRKPQKAPPSAPAPVVLCSWRVSGFFLPKGQLTTA